MKNCFSRGKNCYTCDFWSVWSAVDGMGHHPRRISGTLQIQTLGVRLPSFTFQSCRLDSSSHWPSRFRSLIRSLTRSLTRLLLGPLLHAHTALCIGVMVILSRRGLKKLSSSVWRGSPWRAFLAASPRLAISSVAMLSRGLKASSVSTSALVPSSSMTATSLTGIFRNPESSSLSSTSVAAISVIHSMR